MNARGSLFAAVLVITMGTALIVHGRLIAGFDYGTSGSPVQQDFTKVEISTNVTTTANGVSIVADKAATARDRGEIADPLTDLIRDLHFIGNSDPVTFSLSGLAPNTTYNITVYVYDNQSGNTGKILEWTTNGGTVTNTTDYLDPSSAPVELAPLTTDASGEATITGDHTGGAGGSVIFWNGFEIIFDDPPGTVIVIK